MVGLEGLGWLRIGYALCRDGPYELKCIMMDRRSFTVELDALRNTLFIGDFVFAFIYATYDGLPVLLA